VQSLWHYGKWLGGKSLSKSCIECRETGCKWAKRNETMKKVNGWKEMKASLKKQRLSVKICLRKEMKRGNRKNVNAIGWWSWKMRDDVFLFSMCMNNNGF
jgi:hypothetical protein